MKITELIPEHLRYLRAIGRSPYTIRGAKSGLRDFAKFLQEENVSRPEDLTPELLEEYQKDTAFRLTFRGTLLSARSRSKLLTSVKGFTCFLTEKDYLFHNPGIRIKLPKEPKTLPGVILSTDEMKQLLSAPDMQTCQGYRDRVIIEILYDTAIRRSEMAGLCVADTDTGTGYLHVRGKGDKERIVPLSPRVCELVKNYTLHIRPLLLKEGKDGGWLIPNRFGQRMNPNSIWAAVKRCARFAGINKKVSTHTLRHTCATHMLRNGAPVRHIQELLGHESLTSTQVYTRVTINDLREIHAKYHPGEMTENTDI
ncbi:MAG: tyrosine-type recombinase/integrase [Desulfobacteraceae bacterium]|nr:tyrosine-type recombinase/integrase [Desulfobacteraceae bacterium]